MIRLIQEIIRQLRGKVTCAFLPNYDMSIAQVLVAGADVWLNTPLPPLEASGTSGMKAAVNGVLNLSMLDGWWVEGCIEGVTGWSIGSTATAARTNIMASRCTTSSQAPCCRSTTRSRSGGSG